MNKDHDYQKMITCAINMNTSDIETINVYKSAIVNPFSSFFSDK